MDVLLARMLEVHDVLDRRNEYKRVDITMVIRTVALSMVGRNAAVIFASIGDGAAR
jgi:hypothetical protein